MSKACFVEMILTWNTVPIIYAYVQHWFRLLANSYPLQFDFPAFTWCVHNLNRYAPYSRI